MILPFIMERGKTCSFWTKTVLVIVFLHTFPWVFQLLSTHGIEAYKMEIAASRAESFLGEEINSSEEVSKFAQKSLLDSIMLA